MINEELEGVNDMGEEDDLLFEENQGNHLGAYQHKNQQKIFDANQHDNEDNPNVDDEDKESIGNDMEKDQAVQDNNNFMLDDHSFSGNSLDNQVFNDSNSNHGNDKDYDNGSGNHLDDLSPKDNLPDQTQLPCILRALRSKESNKWLD